MKPCTSRLLLLLVIFSFAPPALSQSPVRTFTKDSFTDSEYASLKELLGVHKKIPVVFERQILIALAYFPELNDVPIEFRIKHTRTPLASRPSWLSIPRSKGERKYIITISDSSISQLDPILLKRMDFNAQVGVLGHELSHIADFIGKSSVGLARVGIGNLSTSFLDSFEFRTDSICIAHGLGYQLLSWSMFVRKAFHSGNWDGADNVDMPVMNRERYMNPATIRATMKVMAIYQ